MLSKFKQVSYSVPLMVMFPASRVWEIHLLTKVEGTAFTTKSNQVKSSPVYPMSDHITLLLLYPKEPELFSTNLAGLGCIRFWIV
jgi:hypothetical protein